MIRALLIAILAAGPISAQEPDREAICQELSDDLVRRLSDPPHSKDYRLYEVRAFVSEALDACIHVETLLFGVGVWVSDLTQAVIINEIGSAPRLLLHCDVDGVDEADIDVVNAYGGRVHNVPYREWLTDGQGGPPRALKTPETRYTREDCEAALDRWMATWR